MKLAPIAAPSEDVAPWICDPIHSHSSGVPTQSPRLPMNMISTTRTAPAPVLSSSCIPLTGSG